MTDSADDIRKMVQERVDQEAAELPPPDEKPAITSDFVRRCINANALGDGTLFAALYRDKYIYCKNLREWLEWTGHYWQLDVMGHAYVAVEGVVEQYMLEYGKISNKILELADGDEENKDKLKKLRRLQSAILKKVSQLRDGKRRNSCLEFAHTIENPLAITNEEFDQKPLLLPCPNGVIDLETGKLKPGRPGDYLSMASPIEFRGIDEPAPLWEKSLLEIFNGDVEMVSYIRRLFGYSITGLVHEKVFPVLYGKSGWNGRTLIVEAIAHVMGPFARPISPEMLMTSRNVRSSSGPSPDIMSLKGLRMAFADETDENHKFSAAQVKRLTGKGELVGRNPNDKRQTYFQQTHKLFLESNSQPQAPPNDKSFWERLHLIEFPISFVNRDPQESHERRAILKLDQQILKEAPGILAWLVRGCLLWQKHGLMPPRKVTDATERYRRNEDLIADFIDECCIREPGAKASSSDLYGRFVTWYHDNVGKNEPSGTWFGKQLSQKYEKTKSEGRNTYHGIMLAVRGGLEGL
jgi:putative DNA primase/helicase